MHLEKGGISSQKLKCKRPTFNVELVLVRTCKGLIPPPCQLGIAIAKPLPTTPCSGSKENHKTLKPHYGAVNSSLET